MKIKEIRIKSMSELIKDLEEKRKKLETLRFELTTKKNKDYSELKKTKNDIARILTVMSEKRFLNKEE
jgi:ribosomal protein L29